MVKEVKLNKVKKIVERLQDAKSIVLVDYKGINIEEVNDLRTRLRNAQVDYFVEKNTLIKIALNQLSINALDDLLVGPTAVVVSKIDEATPAKEITGFIKDVIKDRGILNFKAGYVDKNLFDAKNLAELSKLPSKDELIAKLLGSLNSPVTGLVFVLQGVLRNFVYVVDAIAKAKEENK